MARKKDQSARREQLIQATLDTIAERGLVGASLKSIADAAGISPRLVAYYYPDLESLIEAAHQAASERYYSARQQVLLEDARPGEKLLRLIRSGLPHGADRLLSQALNEIAVNAGRSRMHATLMTLLFDREVSLYTAVLEAGRATGEFTLTEPVDVIARNFVFLEDALGMHLLAQNSSVDLARAEAQLVSLARATTGADVSPTGAERAGRSGPRR
jgi:AcrR family transcriptional regulator